MQNYPAAAPDENSREEENGLPLGLPNTVVFLLSCEKKNKKGEGGERGGGSNKKTFPIRWQIELMGGGGGKGRKRFRRIKKKAKKKKTGGQIFLIQPTF